MPNGEEPAGRESKKGHTCIEEILLLASPLSEGQMFQFKALFSQSLLNN